MRIPITIQMYTGENGIAIISSMLGAYGKYVPLEISNNSKENISYIK